MHRFENAEELWLCTSMVHKLPVRLKAASFPWWCFFRVAPGHLRGAPGFYLGPSTLPGLHQRPGGLHNQRIQSRSLCRWRKVVPPYRHCSCSLNNSRTSSLAGIFHPTFTRTSGNLKVKHSSTVKDFTLNAGIPQRIQQYKSLTSVNKTLSACSLLIRTGDVWLRLILQ